MKTRNALSLSLFAAVLLVAGCKKEEMAQEPGQAAAKPAEAPKMAAAPSGREPVDTCALVTKEEATKLLGQGVGDPERMAAQGSLLGMCDYMAMKPLRTLSISARPADEWDATIKAYEGMEAVPGVGEAAHYSSRLGLMVKPAGKPYFLHLIANDNPKDVLTAAAKAAIE